MPRPTALSLSAIDCEAPEEAAPLIFVFDIALARACAAADNPHSAYMSFEFCLRCDVLVYHFLGWGMVLPIIYRCIFMRACPTADQTEGAYVAIMRVRIGDAIQARTVARDSIEGHYPT